MFFFNKAIGLLLIFNCCSFFLYAGFEERTYSNIRGIEFLEPEIGLEEFDHFKLIDQVDFYIDLLTMMGLGKEQQNFSALAGELEANQNGEYEEQRRDASLAYALGASLDVFFYTYAGIGFTYARMSYLNHELNLIKKDPKDYEQTIGYSLYGYGNSYHASFLGRAPFGPRKDNNIYLILGLGYSYFDVQLDFTYLNKVTSVKEQETFYGSGHGVHGLFEIKVKIDWFDFSFGAMIFLATLEPEYQKTDLIKEFPYKILMTDLAPFLFFKIGGNF